jgi:hypothetical protein
LERRFIIRVVCAARARRHAARALPSLHSMANITISMPPPPPPGPPPPLPRGPPPGPPPATQYRTATYTSFSPHKLLQLGNLAVGLALIIANFFSFLGTFITFQLLSVVILLFLVLGGCLLSVAALCSSRSLALYVGFLQFPLGSGLLLVLLGVLNLGSGGLVGNVVGGIAIGWGVVNILGHLWLRTRHAAVHVPLLRQF